MLDFRVGFERLESSADNAFNNFVRAYNSEYALLANTLGFQKALADKVIEKKNVSPDSPEAWLFQLCMYNMRRIHSATRALGSQYFPVCYAIIRIVMESFPKLFYCLRNPVNTHHLFCAEEYYYQQIMKRPDKSVNDFCKQFKKDISGMRKKYKNLDWIRNKVYAESLDEIKRLYSICSHNSHPTFDPIHAENEQDVKEGWELGLTVLNNFSILNLFILINILQDQLMEINEYYSAKQFVVRKMQYKQYPNEYIRLLYPDVREYWENLPFVLPLKNKEHQ